VSLLGRELPTLPDFGKTARGYPAGELRARTPEVLTPLSTADGTAPRVGTCELYFELGTGGMATVYLGIHHGAHGFEKLVAVKRLLPKFREDAHYIAMLADEASVSAYASHSCLRDVFDLGVAADGSPYLVMEFLVGQPLSRVSAAMRAEPALLETKGHHQVAAHVIASCCNGIHAAHQLSRGHAPLDVVHRDLTPENLFVLHDGTVRVTDFGIMHARTRRQRPSGEMVLKGKASYMSPEYLRRAPYDRRTDVWTLGVVLWELLTGMRLFFRPRESDSLAAVLEAPIPPPSTMRRGISRTLDAIVARSVTRDVDARYRTADEMANDLHAYLACEGAVGTQDVGAWLQQLLPDSLRSQTALVESARVRRAAPPPEADDGSSDTTRPRAV
jgi:serine/threonine-protein kinase